MMGPLTRDKPLTLPPSITYVAASSSVSETPPSPPPSPVRMRVLQFKVVHYLVVHDDSTLVLIRRTVDEKSLMVLAASAIHSICFRSVYHCCSYCNNRPGSGREVVSIIRKTKYVDETWMIKSMICNGHIDRRENDNNNNQMSTKLILHYCYSTYSTLIHLVHSYWLIAD